MSRAICIAVDGPASSGKGTVARLVARSLDYAYIDTGAMFRTIALLAREQQIPWDDGTALESLTASTAFEFSWNGTQLRLRAGSRDLTEAIRAEDIGQGASTVAVVAQVRQALLDKQRALARAGGVVMDGRDIGTVILPDAELKIFLDASVEVRAARRHMELRSRGVDIDLETVRDEIIERDHRDRSRAIAPLAQAADAIRIDSSEQTPAEVGQLILEFVRNILDDKGVEG